MFSLACMLIAILLHGLGHLLAAALCGVSLDRLTLSHTGLRLQTRSDAFPSYKAEACIALGGPLGNLLGNALFVLAALLAANSRAAAFFEALNAQLLPFSLYLAVWNMLPIDGFDGGRLLRCLLCGSTHLERARGMLFADRLLSVTSVLCLLILWFFSVYLLLRGGSSLSLYVFCVELFVSLHRSFPLTMQSKQKGLPHSMQQPFLHYSPKSK